MKVKMRFGQLAIAFDQFAGTLVGLFLSKGAWADETLSARAWREGDASKGWRRFRKLVDGIFFWQDEHCKRAYRSEQERMHMAPEYRNAESS